MVQPLHKNIISPATTAGDKEYHWPVSHLPGTDQHFPAMLNSTCRRMNKDEKKGKKMKSYFHNLLQDYTWFNLSSD